MNLNNFDSIKKLFDIEELSGYELDEMYDEYLEMKNCTAKGSRHYMRVRGTCEKLL